MDDVGNVAPHEKLITPGHLKACRVLRVVGPVVFLVGIILTAIGFFTVILGDPFDHKVRAALPFVGMPLMFVGAAMSMMAFMGAAARYAVSEHAPVAKDAANYMGVAAAPGVTAAARALGTGLREGLGGKSASEQDREFASVACPACDTPNDPDAKFCDGCGEPLPALQACGACGTENDAHARHCDSCGRALGQT